MIVLSVVWSCRISRKSSLHVSGVGLWASTAAAVKLAAASDRAGLWAPRSASL